MAKAGGNLLNTYVADYVVFDLETTGIFRLRRTKWLRFLQ